MSRPRRLRWDLPASPIPKHPYRDSALVYLGFAVIVVLVAWATGGPLGRAVGIAVVLFVVATGWSWWRWHQRIAQQARTDREPPT